MNPLLATAIVAGATTAARWSKGENLTMNHIIAFFVMAVLLNLIYTINKELGNGFAWLAVVGTLFAHFETIAEAVNK